MSLPPRIRRRGCITGPLAARAQQPVIGFLNHRLTQSRTPHQICALRGGARLNELPQTANSSVFDRARDECRKYRNPLRQATGRDPLGKFIDT